jgi:hypothetical protein
MEQKKLLKRSGMLIIGVLLSIMNASAIKYYVYPQGGASNWGTREDGIIQEGIPATLDAEDEIWFQGGDYEVATPWISSMAITVYGGFSGTETTPEQRAKVAGGKAWSFATPTVIKVTSATNNSGVFAFAAAATNSAVTIDGITLDGNRDEGVTGSRAVNISANPSGFTFSMSNCILKNFDSGNNDGGAINTRASAVEIAYCLVTNNKAIKGGGAYIDYASVHDCEFTENEAAETASITLYQGNQSGGGGGMLVANTGSATVYNNIIARNRAAFGGGVHLRANARLYNNIITDNTSTYSGSGIAYEGRDNATGAYNNIIVNNKSSEAGGAGVAFASTTGARTHALINSILYNNTDASSEVVNIASVAPGQYVSTVTFTNNILDKTDYEGITQTACIVETDPAKLFVNASADDFHPAANSPAINAGTTTGITVPAKDLDGNRRVQGASIDIGAYEFAETGVSLTVNAKDYIITSLTSGLVEYGTVITPTFTLASGYHSPYVTVNGTITEATESAGTYTLPSITIEDAITINIGAFASNVFPTVLDTYCRTTATQSSADYVSVTTLGLRSTAGSNWACSPLLKFVVPWEFIEDYIDTEIYDKVTLQLVPSATYDAFEPCFIGRYMLYSTEGREIDDVPTGTIVPLTEAEGENLIASHLTFEMQKDTPMEFDVTDYTTLGASEIRLFIVSTTETSSNTIRYFHSLENGNPDYVPVLKFSKEGASGLTPNVADDAVNPVVKTQYYTLQGVEIAQPQSKGLYIVKKTRTSSKTEVSKVIIK